MALYILDFNASRKTTDINDYFSIRLSFYREGKLGVIFVCKAIAVFDSLTVFTIIDLCTICVSQHSICIEICKDVITATPIMVKISIARLFTLDLQGHNVYTSFTYIYNLVHTIVQIIKTNINTYTSIIKYGEDIRKICCCRICCSPAIQRCASQFSVRYQVRSRHLKLC